MANPNRPRSRDQAAVTSSDHQTDPAPEQMSLASLLDHLPGIVYRCRNNPEWTKEFISGGVAELTGYQPSDFVGAKPVSFASIIHPLDRPMVWQRAQLALSERKAFAMTYRIRTAGGDEKWVRECGRGIFSADGTLLALEGFISDITEQRRSEAALAENERMLRAILDQSFQFIGLLDVDGRVLRANETALKLVRLRNEDLMGMFFWDTPWWSHSKIEQERLKEAVARAREGEFVRFQTSHPSPDGRMLVVDFSLKPVFDDSGRVSALIPEGRDITEWKTSERALRESEERFAKAFKASPDAILLTDADTGAILEANEGFERMTGWTWAEAVGQTTLDLRIWNSPEHRAEMISRVRRDGRVVDFYTETKHRNGTPIPCLISVETTEINGRHCLVSVTRDITERRRSEEALRASEARFRSFFESPLIGLSITSPDGRFIEVNEHLCRMLDYSHDELLGMTWMQLTVEEHLPESIGALEDLIQGGSESRFLQKRYRTRTGRIIDVELSIRPVPKSDGAIDFFVVVTRDVTAQKEMAEAHDRLEAQLRQTQKLESLGQLAGGIAHDFNNILGAIIPYTELADLDLQNPAEARQHLAQIRKAAERAKNLVRQILTFSRQQTQERKPVHLAPIIEEVLQLLRSTFPATTLIRSERNDAAPPVLANANQVHQVIMNLATNAMHAMKGRQAELSIQLDAVEADHNLISRLPALRAARYACLTVQDKGCGMDETTLKHIFEPFFTTKGPGEGTGLGLAVVHGIMQDHEGAIDVESRPDVGTTFRLYFPAHEAAWTDTKTQAQTLPLGRGEKILFVDDESALCAISRSLLGRLGYGITTETDPQKAFELFHHAPHEFDLIVTDLTMPGMTGLELATAAMKVRPGMPVLLVTGFSGLWTPEKVRGLGVRDLLQKPITPTALAIAVRQTLDGDSPVPSIP